VDGWFFCYVFFGHGYNPGKFHHKFDWHNPHISICPHITLAKAFMVKGVYGYGYVNNNKKNTHICDLAIALMKKMPDIDTDIDTMVPHILSIEQYKVMVEEIQKKDCIDHLK